MAQRRMFSKSITNSSQFLMMPNSSQNLYFHLGMNADDDGFCEHFSIMRMTDSKPDDLRVLQSKGFVHIFDDKVLVITAWKENNYLRSDRYTESKYLEIYKAEMKLLTSGIPSVDTGKDREGKDREGKDNKNAAIPLDSNIKELCQFLYDNIKTKSDPIKWRSNPPKLKAWYSDIDKLHRIDKIDIDIIKQVIDYCTSDSFWSNNIMSGEKLRKHFDTLFKQMGNKKQPQKQFDGQARLAELNAKRGEV